MKNRTAFHRIFPLLLAACIILTCSACRTQQAFAYGTSAVSISIIAHRAGASCAPENTLSALRQAIVRGADAAEIDLRLSADGVVVALHDESLKRTTGLDRLVGETNYDLIQTLDAGAWFSAEYAGEAVPTLAQILHAAKGRIRLMLELKDIPDDELLLRQVIEQIRTADMTEQCSIASTQPEQLERCKLLAPELETVLIHEMTWPELWTLGYVDAYSIALSTLSAKDVERAHEAGRRIYTWTVNEWWEVRWALSLGVDGLVSDDPAVEDGL